MMVDAVEAVGLGRSPLIAPPRRLICDLAGVVSAIAVKVLIVLMMCCQSVTQSKAKVDDANLDVVELTPNSSCP